MQTKRKLGKRASETMLSLFTSATGAPTGNPCTLPERLTPSLQAPLICTTEDPPTSHCREMSSDYSTWVRRNTTDIAVHKENMPEYPPLAAALIPHGMKYVLDAGANDGYSSWLFAKHMPDATVVAVEPSPANFAMVQLNAKDFHPRLVSVNAGVWDQHSNIDVKDLGVGAWALVTREAGKWVSPLERWERKLDTVAAVPITSLMEDLCIPRWDFVKMDIEYAPIHCVQGISRCDFRVSFGRRERLDLNTC